MRLNTNKGPSTGCANESNTQFTLRKGYKDTRLWVVMLSANYNDMPVISWRSVLLVEETGENHRSAASH